MPPFFRAFAASPEKEIPFGSGSPRLGLRNPPPGHMWMRSMGYLDGANGLLLYPEDRSGYLKYADFWSLSNTTLRMGWCDVVVVGPGERYAPTFEYVVKPMRARVAAIWIRHRQQRWIPSRMGMSGTRS